MKQHFAQHMKFYEPHAFAIIYIMQKVQICMTQCSGQCISINGFKQILSHSVSVSGIRVQSQLLKHSNFDSCQARVDDIK